MVGGVGVCGGDNIPSREHPAASTSPHQTGASAYSLGLAIPSMEMTGQISKALPKQPGVPATTKALIIISCQAILYLSQDV